MKAAVIKKYGNSEVLQILEVEKPIPGPNDVFIRIHSSAVNSGDWRIRKADPFAVRFIFGFFKPKIQILGSVYSGIIEQVGSQVKNFKIGDEVFGHTDMQFGSYAEYICINEHASIAKKPEHISHNEAASIPFGGVTAWHFLKQIALKPGQKVLVIGASGAVGTAAIQIAKYYGASVTGVCSKSNIELVKSIGADEVIDYTIQDFAKSNETYDVIIDTVNSISIFKSLKTLNKNGNIILSAAGLNQMIQGLLVKLLYKHKIYFGVISHSAASMNFLKQLLIEHKYKAVIDKVYTLDQISTAHAYAEQGHKKGNVVIEIQ